VPFPANTDRSDYSVFYRIIGKNGVGYGFDSDSLSVVTDTYPAKPATPTNASETTPTNLEVEWTNLGNSDLETGRDPITTYVV
jgi:hypothetical protein